MPDDAEMHTPAPWTDEADDPNLVCVKRRGKGLPPVLFALAETLETDEADTTAEANAQRIVACVNFCEGVSTADLEESLERGDTLADSDEAIVALLNEVGRERNELRDENERLKERVAELPERQRQVYVLSRRHGLTYEEIATVMDISPKTVDNHMVKALKFLREGLRRYHPQASG